MLRPTVSGHLCKRWWKGNTPYRADDEVGGGDADHENHGGVTFPATDEPNDNNYCQQLQHGSHHVDPHDWSRHKLMDLLHFNNEFSPARLRISRFLLLPFFILHDNMYFPDCPLRFGFGCCFQTVALKQNCVLRVSTEDGEIYIERGYAHKYGTYSNYTYIYIKTFSKYSAQTTRMIGRYKPSLHIQ